VLLAVVGAVLVAFWGGEDDPEPVVTAEPNGAGEGGDTVADADDRYQTALDACEAALERDDLEEARSQARIALDVRPGDEAATQCQSRAQSTQADLDTFDRGVRHFEAGRLAEAYQAFDSLPENSPLRERNEVRRAIRSYAGMKLQEGESALNDDPNEALQIAQFVLAMVGLTPEQQSRANQLQRDAEGRGAGEEAGSGETQVADAQQAGGTERRRQPRGRGRGRGRQTGGGGGSSTQQTTQQQTSTSTDPTPSRGGGGGGGPSIDEQVRQCALRGDNPCIIRLLEGRARSQTQLGQLIEAYRARGQTNAALRHMRTFVQRFRGTPRARQYQQILSRHQ
jgi:hypothetical protein